MSLEVAGSSNLFSQDDVVKDRALSFSGANTEESDRFSPPALVGEAKRLSGRTCSTLLHIQKNKHNNLIICFNKGTNLEGNKIKIHSTYES